jgi:signal peptidase II
MQTEAGASLIPPEPARDGQHSHSPVPPAARRARLFAILGAVAVVVYGCDQVTKFLAMSRLVPDAPRHLLGTVLQLRLIRNAGAAFSIATNATWVLTLIAVVVVVVVVRASRRLGSIGWAFALGLLLGGSLGNLTDRLVREPGFGRGHVVDFLELPHWPIFNLADSSIVSAAVLIGLLALRGVSLDGTRVTKPATPPQAEHG